MQHMITYTLDGLRPALGPIVYAIRNGDAYLYIGMSRCGMSRTFSATHAAAIEALATGTHLDIIPCDSANAARALEARMIRQHKPALNKAGNPSYSRASPRYAARVTAHKARELSQEDMRMKQHIQWFEEAKQSAKDAAVRDVEDLLY